MISGPRDSRIKIERPLQTSLDSFGGSVVTWSDLGTRWAASKPVKDGERFGNAEAIATITHRFQILWDVNMWDQLDPKCRITFDGRTYDVVAVKEIGRREGIEISATARAENG